MLYGNEGSWKDYNLQYPSVADLAAVLTFKVLISTPLLAVSKATDAEVQKVLDTTKDSWIQYYQELISASTHLHRIRSPSVAIIDLWSCSELILDSYASSSMFFLHNLPDSLKSCTRRLVICSSLLGADDGDARIAWAKGKTGRGGAFFTNWISDNLPNLRTVAIKIPDSSGGMEWNWNPASDLLCEMLQHGRLDTVRFFYKEDREHTETDGSSFRHVTLSEYTYEGLEGLDDSFLSGVEESISSTSIVSELWRDLGVRRVVKITGSQARIGKERAYSKPQGSSTDRDQVERQLQLSRARPGSA